MNENPYESPKGEPEPGEPLITPASEFPLWFQLALVVAGVLAIFLLTQLVNP